MEIRIRLGMMEDYPSPYADISYEKVECPEHVKLSVEHADVAVMCLGQDATIEGEQGDAGNEYARKRHRSAMGGTQPECESHRGLLVSGSQRW